MLYMVGVGGNRQHEKWGLSSLKFGMRDALSKTIRCNEPDHHLENRITLGLESIVKIPQFMLKFWDGYGKFTLSNRVY